MDFLKEYGSNDSEAVDSDVIEMYTAGTAYLYCSPFEGQSTFSEIISCKDYCIQHIIVIYVHFKECIAVTFFCEQSFGPVSGK